VDTEKIRANLAKIYKIVYPLTDTLYRVWKDEKCGVFSATSNLVVVPLEFDNANRLTDTFFSVKKNGRWGIFSTQSKSIILQVEYDIITHLTDKLFKVQQGRVWGTYFTETGKIEWKEW